MYRHLLVPLDDSPLSAETVNQAVKLARTLGAKVTFFHAQADYGASSIGALERVMSRLYSTNTWPAKRGQSWPKPKWSPGRRACPMTRQ
jgi:nucleotide-binding universal stress UspA family protein